ncbi:Rieske (2Fe-2S) protein [Planktothricoides raciborskii]|uniref:Rieske (2Fe-2S) protein n=1 Tax=Planktothricoides raciborskii GIHE-MW2 TaxID=2792601 RepID=A0AAU8JKI3_9CYAN
MKRRSFLGWMGVGAIASSLPVAIAACSQASESGSTDNPPTTNTAAPPAPETVATADEFVAVGSVAELDQKGFLLNKVADTEVIVVRNPQSTATLVALNALCTHKGCKVEWKGEASEFSCPCHGAKFALDGEVTNAPATEPLATYSAKIEGTQVLVSVG